MSLDLYFKINPCKTCGRSEHSENFNITYNLSPMWYKIYPDAPNMVHIDEMTGAEALPILENAFDILQSNPEEFRKLNPKNGFGTYESFNTFLFQLIEASRNYPDSVWESWR